MGEQSPGVRRAAAQIIVDLVDYRDLFTADRVPADLRPWGGATASAVAEMPCGRQGNKTPAVPGDVLQPMLAAALHLVQTLGPHVVELNEQIHRIDRAWATKAPGLRHGSPAMVSDINKLLADHQATGTPLPMLEEHDVNRRLTAGWDTNDPLLPVSTGTLARQAGYVQLWTKWMPALRKPLTDTLNAVGIEKIFGRNAAEAPTTDDAILLPWTLPLHRSEAVALIGIARTAAIVALAAASGMRASELMELRVGCRRPVEEPIPGLKRYRIASKIIKGQGLGGTDDEWVVIEPIHRAIELLEQLHDDPRDGVLLLSRFNFRVRYLWFRAWVNSPAGARLGLAPIPDEPVTLRMLRRTVALEMAYRPGGVLAAKLHLKHIAAATTEGYAARPGGAQAELLAEVNKHEADHKLQLVLAEFRNYQQGILPAGPAARSLTDFFATVDADLNTESTAAPKIQRNDRDILNLLSKRAKALHLGPANYCWFTDPSRALCLKLAGTPTADRPMIGMCDSARCPQATHHQHHRPVWAEHAERTKTFLGQLGKTRTTERARLQADYDRALRVITNIDSATGTSATEEQAMRITAAQRIHNENRIRAVMDRLLRGEIPPGGNCDVKTLAVEAGVDRTAFYGTRPYAHLRAEFEHRLQQLRQAGETPDPRVAQIERLKAEIEKLKINLAQANSIIQDLTDFRSQALARIAAQHDEIVQLRAANHPSAAVTRLPSRPKSQQKVIGPC